MAFGDANISIRHKLSIDLESVGFGLTTLYSRAGTRLRYLPRVDGRVIATAASSAQARIRSQTRFTLPSSVT